jgi:hypothetical protein
MLAAPDRKAADLEPGKSLPCDAKNYPRKAFHETAGEAIRINQPGLTSDYSFTPRTASFAALATRNLTTVLAGILIFCRVLGLKPVRAFLFCFTSFPSALSVSRNTPAVLLLVSVAAASAT